MKNLLWLVALCHIAIFSIPCGSAAQDQKNLADLPPAAQAAVSAAFGRDDDGYHLSRVDGGYRAENSRHRLSAHFSSTGATVSSGTDSWTLDLDTFGREGDLKTASPAVVRSEANRIEYRRGTITEWYINGPLGLEQGFTITSRPEGTGDKRLVIALNGTGLKPAPAGETSLSLTRPDGSEAFRYGGLAAWDADAKALPVQMALVDGRVVLTVDDRTARYPVIVDPTFQTARLTLFNDGAENDNFGKSVALSADGNTALISAYNKSVGGNVSQGAAYVLVRAGTSWTYQTRLTASDGAEYDNFGRTVALSADGNTALIGASNKTVDGKPSQGAAYAFVRSGSVWSQQDMLSQSDGLENDNFGRTVAISGDGNTVLIGANNKTVQGKSSQGAAYIFTRSDSVWSEQAILTASDGVENDNFGRPVTISADGTTALIGANNKTVGGNLSQGAAYVFVRSGSDWSLQTMLAADDGVEGDYFGSALAISADGTSALISASSKAVAEKPAQGAVYVFGRTGQAWSQPTILTADDGAEGDYFGFSLALSADGGTALIGAYNKTVQENQAQGGSYIFVRTGLDWNQQAVLNGNDSSGGDYFGFAVSLSSDGSTALIGAYNKTIGEIISQGVAYVFSRADVTWSQQARLIASAGTENDYFGFSGSISADGTTALIGAHNKTIDGKASQGAAYVFTRVGAIWQQEARLTAADGAESDYFGYSLAISADGNTALIGSYNKSIEGKASQGAAYVFSRSGTVWSQQELLAASDGSENDYFGRSVAISSDGSTALIGAYNKTVGGNPSQGAAYAFVRAATAWSQQAILIQEDGLENDYFGRSLAISADGNTALIGAYKKTVAANPSQGAAYTFTRSGSTWGQQAVLTAADGAENDYFGRPVILSADGTTALIGAYNKTIEGKTSQGAAYAFTSSGSTWTHQFRLTASDGAEGDYFGSAMAISADGNTALIGAYNKTVGVNASQGTVYPFTRSGSLWSQRAAMNASDGAGGDSFGSLVAIASNGDSALIGAYNKTIGGNSSQGAAYAFNLGFAAGFTLSVSIPAGPGSGTVTSDIGGINCIGNSQGTCLVDLPADTTLTLGASTSGNSTFTGWSQDCSGFSPCILAMTTDRSVTASFGLGPSDNGPMAKISSTGYDSIGNAYSAAGAGETILAVTGLHPGSTMTLDLGKNVVFKGGFDPLFETTGLPSILQGVFTIRSGSLRVDNVRVKP